jgi:S-adenosylmethionine synthetase
MTPPQVHINLLVLFRAGLYLIVTVAEPGIQGAVVTGTHGAGVGTPSAAAVAAATAGLDWVVHIPKGIIFFIGMLSMIVADGMFAEFVIFSGVIIRLLGAAPKLHCNIAPIHTNCPIHNLLRR